jgi:hypothetical protein
MLIVKQILSALAIIALLWSFTFFVQERPKFPKRAFSALFAAIVFLVLSRVL